VVTETEGGVLVVPWLPDGVRVPATLKNDTEPPTSNWLLTPNVTRIIPDPIAGSISTHNSTVFFAPTWLASNVNGVPPNVTLAEVKKALWETPTRRILLLPAPIVWVHDSVEQEPPELAQLVLLAESNAIEVAASTGWNIADSVRGTINNSRMKHVKPTQTRRVT
jgi:hypothetical protein